MTLKPSCLISCSPRRDFFFGKIVFLAMSWKSLAVPRSMQLRESSRIRRSDRLDFVGDHLEARERARSEGRHDGDVGGIAGARHQDAADPRLVVPCIERVPAAAEIDFEPGAEIHR